MTTRWHVHCPCVWSAACTANLAPKLRESAHALARDRQPSVVLHPWATLPRPESGMLSTREVRRVWLWSHEKPRDVTYVAMQDKFRRYFCSALLVHLPQRICNTPEAQCIASSGMYNYKSGISHAV